MKFTEWDIADILTEYNGPFPFLRNMIVPNVRHGMPFQHECDLLIVTKSLWATEVEIKVTMTDLKKDQVKKHGHYSNLIKKLFFAFPEKLLLNGEQYVPERAGIIVIKQYRDGTQYASVHRSAQENKQARKLTHGEYNTLLRLGCMRYWSHRKKLRKAAGSF